MRSLPAESFISGWSTATRPPAARRWRIRRAAAGYPEPFNVRYWGVGNESWGCGGNFTAQEYAVEFRRFTTWVPRLSSRSCRSSPLVRTTIVGIGRAVFSKRSSARVPGLALDLRIGAPLLRLEPQSRTTRDWVEGKGDALKFDAVDWYELLQQGDVMESLIERPLADHGRDRS